VELVSTSEVMIAVLSTPYLFRNQALRNCPPNPFKIARGMIGIRNQAFLVMYESNQRIKTAGSQYKIHDDW
jgi:hypothetical protein